MTLRDLAKTAFRNLGRHLARTVLSAVGDTIGIVTIVTMMSLGVGVRREFIGTIKSVGLERIRVRPVVEDRTAFTSFSEPKRKVLITPELLAEMRAREDVIEARPHIYLPGSATINLQIGEQMLRVRIGEFIWGFSDPFEPDPVIVAGTGVNHESQGEIVVSARALEALGYTGQAAFEGLIGREVALVLKTPRGDQQSFPFRVVGVLETVYGSEAGYFGSYIGVNDALAIKSWWYNDPDLLEHEGYDALTIRAASISDAVQIVEQLEAKGFTTESLKAILDMVNRVTIVAQTALGSVGGLALFVAAIGIANTMVMAVYERTREIGILKAVGASPADIRSLFVTEASLIGLLGGIVGTLAGWLLGLLLNELMLAILRWQQVPVEGRFFLLTPWLVLLALAFATVVGLLAGLYPAARAARLDPLEALRYE